MIKDRKANSQSGGITLVELLVILTLIVGLTLAVVAWTYFNGRWEMNTLPEAVIDKLSFVNLAAAGAILTTIGIFVKRYGEIYYDHISLVFVALMALASGVGAVYLYFEIAEVRNILITVLVFLVAAIAAGGTAAFLSISDYIAGVLVSIWAIVTFLVALILGFKVFHFLYSVTF